MDLNPDRLQVIDLANKAFGESGWSFGISSVALDFIDENRPGVYSAGASAVVRVQRANGVYREEVGYGWGSGPHKAEVIAKSKKDAVTDGLKGAVINFGGDISKRVNTTTPRKPVNSIPETSCPQGNALSKTPVSSPAMTAVKPSATLRNLNEGQVTGNLPCAQVMPSTIPPVASKVSPVPNRVIPVPRVSPPLAVPLPKSTSKSEANLSEEEQAKRERKRRQRLLQEEFRKKHLLEQAKSQEKQGNAEGSVPSEQSRVPLKEQVSNHYSRQPQSSSRNNPAKGNAASSSVPDDDILLSTQDMEAMLQIADETNMSRRAPILSSPSIANPSASEAKPVPGKKRTDLSSFAFNPEKKPRGS